jgi:hypothetical protein
MKTYIILTSIIILIMVSIILFHIPGEAKNSRLYKINIESIGSHEYIVLYGNNGIGVTHKEDCVCKY